MVMVTPFIFLLFSKIKLWLPSSSFSPCNTMFAVVPAITSIAGQEQVKGLLSKLVKTKRVPEFSSLISTINLTPPTPVHACAESAGAYAHAHKIMKLSKKLHPIISTHISLSLITWISLSERKDGKNFFHLGTQLLPKIRLYYLKINRRKCIW